MVLNTLAIKRVIVEAKQSQPCAQRQIEIKVQKIFENKRCERYMIYNFNKSCSYINNKVDF